MAAMEELDVANVGMGFVAALSLSMTMRCKWRVDRLVG